MIILNAAILFLNIGVFSITLYIANKGNVNLDDVVSYDGIALSVSMLETLLTVIGVGLAILAFYGYENIKKTSYDVAAKIARETADEEIRKYQNRLEQINNEEEEAQKNKKDSNVNDIEQLIELLSKINKNNKGE